MRIVVRSALLISVLVLAVVSLCGRVKNETRRATESSAPAEDESALFVG